MDSLLLSCRALSSPTTCRFIPAHSGLPTLRELSHGGRIEVRSPSPFTGGTLQDHVSSVVPRDYNDAQYGPDGRHQTRAV